MFNIFLDRDGTLIVDKHYLKDPADVEVLPGVPEAIRIFQSMGCRLFLFSNQSGIARGLLTMMDVELCNQAMLEQIGCGNFFCDICIAPEKPDDPIQYRKPSPRFINEMITKYSLKKEKCFMIGDKYGDIMVGQNAGIQSVLICDKHTVSVECENMIKAGKSLGFGSLLNFALFLQQKILQ